MSVPDLGRLFVRHLIVHDVPRRHAADPTDVGLDLSEAPAPDDPEVARFFKERLTATLMGHGQEVYPVRDSGSPVPALIEAYLTDDGERDLVDVSQHLAQHLYAVQNYTNPAGLLTVVTGDLGDRPAIAVLKLKKEEGVRLREEEVDGQPTLSIEYLRELMLTEETTLFKAGLFWLAGDEVRGMVSDEQQKGAPAAFFLQTFLGCELVEAPAVLTQRFSDAARAFIASDVDSQEEKYRYYIALHAELASNRAMIRPRSFIRENIEPDRQDDFARHLVGSGVPASSFKKDLERVASTLRRKSLRTQSGIRVAGTTDAWSEHVDITSADGLSTITIRDQIVTYG